MTGSLGQSHSFKYLRLESYEDTLTNLAFRPREGGQLALAQSDAFREDYTLHHTLDAEGRDSLLNVRVFEDPFGYALNIATGVVGGLSLTSPLRPFREYIFWLEYANTTDADMPAPLFVVSSPQDPPMRLSPTEPRRSGPLQVLGISHDGPAGVLRPGARHRVPIYYYREVT